MATESQHGAIAKSVWLNAALISRQLDNSLGAVHGIGLSEYMVLLNLLDAPNHALRRIDVAEALARSASGITRMLMPMEKTGLISKATNERDARVSLVKLTPAGEELCRNASATLDVKAESLLRNLSEKDASLLLKLLRLI